MTTYYTEPYEKPWPLSLAARLWIFTSLTLGAGCGLYFTAIQDDDAFLFIPIIIGAAICSLPVLLVLSLLLPYIDTLSLQPAVKIRRVALACLACVAAYGLLISVAYTNSYNNPQYLKEYSIHFLAATAVLFFCSLVAIFLSNKVLTNFFTAIDENAYLPVDALPEKEATENN